MGRVYLVDMLDKESRGLRVAIKTLKSPKADEPDSAGQSAIFIAERNRHYALVKERFRSESATWMELGAHPNIVIALHVLDVRGLPHLLMEYVGGGSLGDWIASGRTWTCAALAVNFATQICHGMRHAAKKNGLVHRDLKPANILVREDGTVKVTDFGLSRAYEVNEKPTVGGDAVTTMSMAGGTRLYMAPEQFAGRADTRSDVFSFGAILYEMLTGRRLFAGSERPKPLDTSALAQFKVHSELIAVVQRCLCHSPAEQSPSS